jgi:phenylalanyl-tRNA synthetase alpha chain
MSNNNFHVSIASLHPFEIECLSIMKKENIISISTYDLANKSSKLDLNKANRAINWLKEKKFMNVTVEVKKTLKLSEKGLDVVTNGLPEEKLLKWITNQTDTVSMKIAIESSGLTKQEFNAALGVLKRQSFIELTKGNITATEFGKKGLESFSNDEGAKILTLINSGKFKQTKKVQSVLETLFDRGLIEEISTKINIGNLTDEGLNLRDSLDFSIQYQEHLTPEMIKAGQNFNLRPFDVDISAPPVPTGKRHFYLQAIDYVRQVWLSLGFKEMEGSIVQSNFWNFDTLFVPQDHPARDAQDTFFVKNPPKGTITDEDFENVSQTHLNGGKTGSKGWRGTFDRNVSESLVLRTHTTCLSARTVRKLKEDGYPAKYFAVGRNYRNEKVDWKHLAEFDQVEGIVVDPNVTFPDLLGYLKIFFKAMGFPQARFRPSFYPYTEPSVGIDVLHPIKKVWYELGGAGVFRPEVVEPLLGEDIPVLAWGPGIGRIITEQYKINDIREQYFNDLEQLRKAPLWMR